MSRETILIILTMLIFLSCLIVGSWVNLQSNIDSLQRDVAALTQTQQRLQESLDTAFAKAEDSQ